MINDLPTIYEVVTGAVKKQQKEKSSSHSGKKSKSNSKAVSLSLHNILVCKSKVRCCLHFSETILHYVCCSHDFEDANFEVLLSISWILIGTPITFYWVFVFLFSGVVEVARRACVLD